MSATPRTDALYFPHGHEATAMYIPEITDSIDFARQLERELAAAQATIKAQEQEIEELKCKIICLQ